MMRAVGKRQLFRQHKPCTSCQRLHSVRNKTSLPQNFTDYDSMKPFDPQIPVYFNFAKDVLDKWTEKEKRGERGSLPALWWVNDNKEEVRWSFEELGFHSRRLANVLCGPCQLSEQDRLLLILPRVPEWWLVNVACHRTGTVLIPGTSQLTSRDILHRLQISGAKGVITDESLAPLLDAVAPDCPSLRVKILVSDRKREGWRNFGDLLGCAAGYETV